MGLKKYSDTMMEAKIKKMKKVGRDFEIKGHKKNVNDAILNDHCCIGLQVKEL